MNETGFLLLFIGASTLIGFAFGIWFGWHLALKHIKNELEGGENEGE